MAAKNGAAQALGNLEQFTLQTDKLVDDVRDLVLTEFKHMPKPWQQMNEDEQTRIINRAADIGDSLVRKAVDLVAARGLPSLPIEVGKITIDGAECKGSFECYADDDALLRIRHLQGSRAMFVLASPDAFNGKTDKPEPEVVGDLSMPKSQTSAILDAMDADGHTANGAAAN